MDFAQVAQEPSNGVVFQADFGVIVLVEPPINRINRIEVNSALAAKIENRQHLVAVAIRQNKVDLDRNLPASLVKRNQTVYRFHNARKNTGYAADSVVNLAQAIERNHDSEPWMKFQNFPNHRQDKDWVETVGIEIERSTGKQLVRRANQFDEIVADRRFATRETHVADARKKPPVALPNSSDFVGGNLAG